jgi:hypothetical protein
MTQPQFPRAKLEVIAGQETTGSSTWSQLRAAAEETARGTSRIWRRR